jgi:hypothetical protein
MDGAVECMKNCDEDSDNESSIEIVDKDLLVGQQ